MFMFHLKYKYWTMHNFLEMYGFFYKMTTFKIIKNKEKIKGKWKPKKGIGEDKTWKENKKLFEWASPP
jgi:hypothetical protein